MTHQANTALPENSAPIQSLTPAAPASGFITERELLTRLPVSRRTVANWRAKKIIPAVKLGARVLFHWPSVEAALLRQQELSH